jgi:hypothetical protein
MLERQWPQRSAEYLAPALAYRTGLSLFSIVLYGTPGFPDSASYCYLVWCRTCPDGSQSSDVHFGSFFCCIFEGRGHAGLCCYVLHPYNMNINKRLDANVHQNKFLKKFFQKNFSVKRRKSSFERTFPPSLFAS